MSVEYLKKAVKTAGSDDPQVGPRVAEMLLIAFGFYSIHTLIDSTQTRSSLSIILEESGSHFDPNVVDAFKRKEADFIEIQKQLGES